jgi:hypothetical protein
MSIGVLLLAAAIILGLLVQRGGLEKVQTDDQNPPPAGLDATTPTAATTPVEVDHADAFKKFVMIDREREPDWFSRITRVRFTGDGELVAETSLPADWRDTGTPSRPAESICTNLFAYVQRGVRRQWHGVTVLAADRTALVTRKDLNGSCRQS